MVSKVFNANVIFELQALSDDDCWSIIMQKTSGKDRNMREFEAIGREIARKCQGVSLVAQTLGSLLRTKRSINEWLCIRDDRIWDLPEDEQNDVLPALWLCYYYLPQPLKQCLSYCCIFPKGYVIRKDMLGRRLLCTLCSKRDGASGE